MYRHRVMSSRYCPYSLNIKLTSSEESHGQRGLAGYTVHGVTRVGYELATKPPSPLGASGVAQMIKNLPAV